VIVALMALTLVAAIAFAAIGTGRLGGWAEAVRGVDDRPVSDDPSPITFVVRPGATAMEIGQDLQRIGLIRSAVAFRVQAEIRGAGARLGMGEYELRRNMRTVEIIEALVAGARRHGRIVTIPEGWRSEEIAQYLEAAGVVRAADFMEVVAGRAATGVPPLPEGAPTYEGYLFPDSYDFSDDPTPQQVVRTFVEQFERRVDESLREGARARGLTPNEMVILASIVEREAARAEERPQIAAVFQNRIRRGMPLQADPTTQYALIPFGTLITDRAYWKAALTTTDLEIDSRYNTYKVNGLPPGPIANPGLDSIRAVAAPADGPWLYFVARGDGSHLFAETLDGHLRNLAESRRGLDGRAD
jgi:UPF0755 protein